MRFGFEKIRVATETLRERVASAWTDPVWSAVIASLILASMGSLYLVLSQYVMSLRSMSRPATVLLLVVSVGLVLLIIIVMRSDRETRTLLFLSAGGTCRDPMAKAITAKLLQTRNLKRRLRVRAVALGPVSGSEASWAARQVIKELYNEDLLANHKPELLTDQLVQHADLILAMDRSLLTTPGKTLPSGKTFLLKEFFGLQGDVVDPWPDGKDSATLSRYRACAEELRTLLTTNVGQLVRVLDLE